MLPVSTLIVLTTIYSLNGIRKINIELSKLEFSSSIESLNGLKENITNEKKQNQEYCDEEIMSLKESKICLKLICAIQTAFDIIWFIVVLALENNSNNIGMAVIYTISSCLLVTIFSILLYNKYNFICFFHRISTFLLNLKHYYQIYLLLGIVPITSFQLKNKN